jgi:zinc D-Ala-D-Ala dipeptidase
MKYSGWYLALLGLFFACASDKVEGVLVEPVAQVPVDSVKMPEAVDLSPLEKTLINYGLINLEQYIPGLKVELMYSTTNNFFGQDVYGDLTHAYLQPEVADRLKKAQESLHRDYPNLTLLVYDGVRPLSVQQILWDNLDKPEKVKPLYVADPKVGSLHNFGVAVDLTIYDTEAGRPLDMGTEYDYFGYEAYPDRELEMMAEGKITRAQVANREILRKVMKEAGFSGIGSEWWHFNAFSRKEAGERYEIVK